MSPDVEEPTGRDPDLPPVPAVSELAAGYLIFELGDHLYALPTEQVTRVVEPQRPVRVPTAPAHFLGVVQIRGQILAVVGLHQLLGIEGIREQGFARRLVAVDVDGRPFAFVADGVLGIRDIPLSSVRETVDAEDQNRSAVCGELDQEEGVVAVLDPGAIVRQL